MGTVGPRALLFLCSSGRRPWNKMGVLQRAGGSQQAGDRRGLCARLLPLVGSEAGSVGVSVSLLSLSVSLFLSCLYLSLSCYCTYSLEATGIGLPRHLTCGLRKVMSSGLTAEPSAQRGRGKRKSLVSGYLPPSSLCVGSGLCFQH